MRKLGEGIYPCMGAPGRLVPRRAPRVGGDGRAAPESFFLQGPVAPRTGPDDEEPSSSTDRSPVRRARRLKLPGQRPKRRMSRCRLPALEAS
ncbi:MAG TPA: hypothetical protein VFE65_14460 [Pseudonocardia sp.]|nr:hypothetical protein [Pseudonocardia sp.]